MGNYRFRLSAMIPNAWLYKLKEMSKTRKRQNKTAKELLKHNPSSVTSSPSSSTLSLSSIAAAAPKPNLSDQRKSYYFTRDLNLNSDSLPKTKDTDQRLIVEPPRKSSRRRRSTKRHRAPQRLVTSSISAGCSCRATIESVWTKSAEDYTNSPLNQTSTSDNDSVLPEYGSDRGLTPDTFDGMLSWSTSCKCSIDNDVVIDIDNNNNNNNNNRFDREFDSEQDHLPPIITRKQEPTKIQRTSAEFSEKNAYGSLSVNVVKEDFLSTTTTTSNNCKSHQHKTTASPVRRHSSSPGVKLRTNSPRLANRRIQGRKSVSSNSSLGSGRSISESFAVVKSSKDPRRDFRESMVEMIVENNIIASKDLEELLACYLSLNSDEYHDLIINVFKQIWFDFLHVRLK